MVGFEGWVAASRVNLGISAASRDLNVQVDEAMTRIIRNGDMSGNWSGVGGCKVQHDVNSNLVRQAEEQPCLRDAGYGTTKGALYLGYDSCRDERSFAGQQRSRDDGSVLLGLVNETLYSRAGREEAREIGRCSRDEEKAAEVPMLVQDSGRHQTSSDGDHTQRVCRRAESSVKSVAEVAAKQHCEEGLAAKVLVANPLENRVSLLASRDKQLCVLQHEHSAVIGLSNVESECDGGEIPCDRSLQSRRICDSDSVSSSVMGVAGMGMVSAGGDDLCRDRGVCFYQRGQRTDSRSSPGFGDNSFAAGMHQEGCRSGISIKASTPVAEDNWDTACMMGGSHAEVKPQKGFGVGAEEVGESSSRTTGAGGSSSNSSSGSNGRRSQFLCRGDGDGCVHIKENNTSSGPVGVGNDRSMTGQLTSMSPCKADGVDAEEQRRRVYSVEDVNCRAVDNVMWGYGSEQEGCTPFESKRENENRNRNWNEMSQGPMWMAEGVESPSDARAMERRSAVRALFSHPGHSPARESMRPLAAGLGMEESTGSQVLVQVAGERIAGESRLGARNEREILLGRSVEPQQKHLLSNSADRRIEREEMGMMRALRGPWGEDGGSREESVAASLGKTMPVSVDGGSNSAMSSVESFSTPPRACSSPSLPASIGAGKQSFVQYACAPAMASLASSPPRMAIPNAASEVSAFPSPGSMTMPPGKSHPPSPGESHELHPGLLPHHHPHHPLYLPHVPPVAPYGFYPYYQYPMGYPGAPLAGYPSMAYGMSGGPPTPQMPAASGYGMQQPFPVLPNPGVHEPAVQGGAYRPPVPQPMPFFPFYPYNNFYHSPAVSDMAAGGVGAPPPYHSVTPHHVTPPISPLSMGSSMESLGRRPDGGRGEVGVWQHLLLGGASVLPPAMNSSVRLSLELLTEEERELVWQMRLKKGKERSSLKMADAAAKSEASRQMPSGQVPVDTSATQEDMRTTFTQCLGGSPTDSSENKGPQPLAQSASVHASVALTADDSVFRIPSCTDDVRGDGKTLEGKSTPFVQGMEVRDDERNGSGSDSPSGRNGSGSDSPSRRNGIGSDSPSTEIGDDERNGSSPSLLPNDISKGMTLYQTYSTSMQPPLRAPEPERGTSVSSSSWNSMLSLDGKRAEPGCASDQAASLLLQRIKSECSAAEADEPASDKVKEESSASCEGPSSEGEVTATAELQEQRMDGARHRSVSESLVVNAPDSLSGDMLEPSGGRGICTMDPVGPPSSDPITFPESSVPTAVSLDRRPLQTQELEVDLGTTAGPVGQPATRVVSCEGECSSDPVQCSSDPVQTSSFHSAASPTEPAYHAAVPNAMASPRLVHGTVKPKQDHADEQARALAVEPGAVGGLVGKTNVEVENLPRVDRWNIPGANIEVGGWSGGAGLQYGVKRGAESTPTLALLRTAMEEGSLNSIMGPLVGPGIDNVVDAFTNNHLSRLPFSLVSGPAGGKPGKGGVVKDGNQAGERERWSLKGDLSTGMMVELGRDKFPGGSRAAGSCSLPEMQRERSPAVGSRRDTPEGDTHGTGNLAHGKDSHNEESEAARYRRKAQEMASRRQKAAEEKRIAELKRIKEEAAMKRLQARRRQRSAKLVQQAWRAYWERKTIREEEERRKLEEERAREIAKRHLAILCTWRDRAHFLTLRRKAVLVQSLWRGGQIRRQFSALRNSAIAIQRAWRAFHSLEEQPASSCRSRPKQLKALHHLIVVRNMRKGRIPPSLERFAQLCDRIQAVTEGARIRRRLASKRLQSIVMEIRDTRSLLEQLAEEADGGTPEVDAELMKRLVALLRHKSNQLQTALSCSDQEAMTMVQATPSSPVIPRLLSPDNLVAPSLSGSGSSGAWKLGSPLVGTGTAKRKDVAEEAGSKSEDARLLEILKLAGKDSEERRQGMIGSKGLKQVVREVLERRRRRTVLGRRELVSSGDEGRSQPLERNSNVEVYGEEVDEQSTQAGDLSVSASASGPSNADLQAEDEEHLLNEEESGLWEVSENDSLVGNTSTAAESRNAERDEKGGAGRNSSRVRAGSDSSNATAGAAVSEEKSREADANGKGLSVPTKPFLKRKSKAMKPQKLDWSKVQTKVNSHLEPDFKVRRQPRLKDDQQQPPPGIKPPSLPPLMKQFDARKVRNRILSYEAMAGSLLSADKEGVSDRLPTSLSASNVEMAACQGRQADRSLKGSNSSKHQRSVGGGMMMMRQPVRDGDVEALNDAKNLLEQELDRLQRGEPGDSNSDWEPESIDGVAGDEGDREGGWTSDSNMPDEEGPWLSGRRDRQGRLEALRNDMRMDSLGVENAEDVEEVGVLEEVVVPSRHQSVPGGKEGVEAGKRRLRRGAVRREAWTAGADSSPSRSNRAELQGDSEDNAKEDLGRSRIGSGVLVKTGQLSGIERQRGPPPPTGAAIVRSGTGAESCAREDKEGEGEELVSAVERAMKAVMEDERTKLLTKKNIFSRPAEEVSRIPRLNPDASVLHKVKKGPFYNSLSRSSRKRSLQLNMLTFVSTAGLY
ncbi:hypothetical protein CBR_g4731 [Chara braunii]|uniref:Uncharacterized protein n=1 Tax=Chara braunii TaxID=69332 RepID=A0A388KIV5_CHABU|nr:hypothetical protein CBR_g4731 [Chara braunii]|eukprot:GBG69903.1 hypothetical protein CBR_g4731 [Chara braunii]